MDSDHDVRASSSDQGDSCRSCSIRDDNGDAAYEPVACFGVNTSISVQKGEILPFRWYIQNNDNIVQGESNCHNLDDGDIPADSMKCFFSVYKNQLENPIIDDVQLDCAIDQWNNDVYYNFFEQHYADAANALGKYSFPIGNAFDTFGEYKVVLERVEYDYCKNNHTDNGEVVERICDVDFALTKPYMIARTALGTKPQASSIDLSDFYDINDQPILNSTDINDILVVNESEYDGGSALPSLVSSFVTNYSNLGVTVNNASFANLFEGGNQITIKKVPGKQIYIFDGNGAPRLTLKELNGFDKPFTMIVKNMDLVIK